MAQKLAAAGFPMVQQESGDGFEVGGITADHGFVPH
jgi:hypothetical protein